jgi:hypothetical protein
MLVGAGKEVSAGASATSVGSGCTISDPGELDAADGGNASVVLLGELLETLQHGVKSQPSTGLVFDRPW